MHRRTLMLKLGINLKQNGVELWKGSQTIHHSSYQRRDYAKVLHMYPRCSEAHINIAYMMQKKHRYKKAWELFNAVLASNPDCVSALEGRSVVHHMMGNCFSALVDISQAIVSVLLSFFLRPKTHNLAKYFLFSTLIETGHQECRALDKQRSYLSIAHGQYLCTQ